MLQSYSNKHTRILNYIIVPRLSQLQHLNLKNNNIKTIQPISKLYAPSLEAILLGDNQINKLKSFRKTVFKRIKQLNLYANYIIEAHPLSQSLIPSEIIMGINSVTQFRWINKLQHLGFISLENNRFKVFSNEQWKYSHPVIYG